MKSAEERSEEERLCRADVKLQTVCKHWALAFDACRPPKKVDMLPIHLLEFHERPGRPLFTAETLITGTYLKYNNNVGDVVEAGHRMTPQAFSHFTYERSGHRLIIVDVQGVGDVYTDPQIHTCDGIGYGCDRSR